MWHFEGKVRLHFMGLERTIHILHLASDFELLHRMDISPLGGRQHEVQKENRYVKTVFCETAELM